MARVRTSHPNATDASTSRAVRGRKPRMKKMSAVKRKVGRPLGIARRMATTNKLSKRFVGIRMPRIQKGRGRGGVRKTGPSTHTPLNRSPHGKLSPIKTRRLHKSKQLNVSRCTICKTSDGDLSSCTKCHKLYHLYKCVLYSLDMVSRASQVKWLCPKCIRCSACQLMIDDPTNVECVNCLRAWHGACKPANSAELDRLWFCNICLKGVNQPRSLKRSGSEKGRRLSKNPPISTPSATISTSTIEPGSNETPRRKRGRPKGSRKSGHVAVADISLPSCSNAPAESTVEEVKEFGNTPKFVPSPHKTRREFGSSPQRKSLLPDQPEVCSTSVGGKLFDVALAKMKEMEVDKKANLPKDKEQWVNFGGESDIKVLYESPYPDDIKSVPLFFICAYCLKPFSEQSSFFVHQ
ncbi:hypothetical protein OSTOST_07770, partial [Ostertagia ostertagi]